MKQRPQKTTLYVMLGVAGIVGMGGLLMWRAERRTNHVALASQPRPVTVVETKAAQFRPHRRYVGTLQPWTSADVGPQLISAYVDTVLVRPGAVVKHGQVLATLDCKPTNAQSRNVGMLARAVEERQRAAAHEAARTEGLLDGGFVSPNEAEQKSALSASEAAQLGATQATMERVGLEVRDCILRAPFDGEVSMRYVDPGAFVRPGNPVVTVVDRSIVRMTADVPEVDFNVIPEGTPVAIHILSTDQELKANVSRRAPAADPGTRTVHFEIDLPDPERKIPVGTTGEVHVEVGKPIAATELPLSSASIRGTRASLFVVENDVAQARTVEVKGEAGGSLFVDPQLPAHVQVVAEGRALLQSGDRVTAQAAPGSPRAPAAPATNRSEP